MTCCYFVSLEPDDGMGQPTIPIVGPCQVSVCLVSFPVRVVSSPRRAASLSKFNTEELANQRRM